MNDLIVRDFNGASVRLVIDERGEPWWVASDVCRVLGIEDVTSAMRRLYDDEKSSTKIGPLSAQAQNLVSEAGLYSLVLWSRKPDAERFKRWVTHDVLPSIRRAGSYGLEAVDLRDPKALAPLTLKLAQLVQEQQAQLTAAQPKVAAFDSLMTADGSYRLQDAGKVLGLGPNKFQWELLSRGFLFRDAAGRLNPRQEYVDRGLFVVRTGTYGPDDGKHLYVQPRLTAKGLAHFREVLGAPAPVGGGRGLD